MTPAHMNILVPFLRMGGRRADFYEAVNAFYLPGLMQLHAYGEGEITEELLVWLHRRAMQLPKWRMLWLTEWMWFFQTDTSIMTQEELMQRLAAEGQRPEACASISIMLNSTKELI